jgi:molybdopterin-guanine dinucleotide biosynthesis protein A
VRREPLTAIVLAGGESSRMGRPKALLPFGGETLIERAVRRIAEVAEAVLVVSGADLALPPLRARVIVDDQPHRGPVAGIVHGFGAAATDVVLVCGCDQPFVRPELVRLLAERLEGFDGVMPRWLGHPQPLLAVYRRALRPKFEALLARGAGAFAILEAAGIRELSAEEIRSVDPEGDSFRDLDTPEAYAEALALLRETLA